MEFVEYIHSPLFRIVVTIIGIYGYLMYRFYYKKQASLKDGHGSREKRSLDGLDYFYDISYEKEEDENTTKKVKRIMLEIDGLSNYDFWLKVETKFDRFIKKFIFNKECQTKDKAFDNEIYVVTDDKNICNQLKTNNELKVQIKGLFDYLLDRNIKVKSLTVSNGRLSLEAKPLNHSNINEDNISEILQTSATHMNGLLMLLEPIAGELGQRPLVANTNKLVIIWRTILFALLANGLVLLALNIIFDDTIPRVVYFGEIIWLSAKATFVIMLILFILALYIFKNSSRLSPFLYELGTFGVIVVFIFCIFEMKELNMYLDKSKPVIVSSKVFSKYTSKGRKSGTTYHMSFSNIEKDGGEYSLSVDRNMYGRFSENDTVFVGIRDGFFGVKWIEDIGQTEKAGIAKEW